MSPALPNKRIPFARTIHYTMCRSAIPGTLDHIVADSLSDKSHFLANFRRRRRSPRYTHPMSIYIYISAPSIYYDKAKYKSARSDRDECFEFVGTWHMSIEECARLVSAGRSMSQRNLRARLAARRSQCLCSQDQQHPEGAYGRYMCVCVYLLR